MTDLTAAGAGLGGLAVGGEVGATDLLGGVGIAPLVAALVDHSRCPRLLSCLYATLRTGYGSSPPLSACWRVV